MSTQTVLDVVAIERSLLMALDELVFPHGEDEEEEVPSGVQEARSKADKMLRSALLALSRAEYRFQNLPEDHPQREDLIRKELMLGAYQRCRLAAFIEGSMPDTLAGVRPAHDAYQRWQDALKDARSALGIEPIWFKFR